jgi:hypothetical protein
MMPRPLRLLARMLLPAALLTPGCASYSTRMTPVLDALVAEDYSQALERLDRKPDPESVLWLTERGLLLRYAGRLTESNAAFASALVKDEDLYTRSLSNEAFSLALNDCVRPYRLKRFELPFIHLYQALNYLELGDEEGAVVEARALSLGLEMRRDELDDPTSDWSLGRMVAAMILEGAGEWNDAHVAYRSALSRYQADSTADAHCLAALIEDGLARTAIRLGLTQAESGAGASAFARAAVQDRSEAHLVIWLEQGLRPALREVHLQVPILNEERDWGEDRLDAWSRSAGQRALELHRGRWDDHLEGVAYFVDVALPVLPEGDPKPSFEYEGLVRSVAAEQGRTVALVLAEDVGDLASSDLERCYPTIAARAAARAIVKALATRAVNKKSGEMAGHLTNILGLATERADTRSWLGLPSRIGFIVIELPVPVGETPVRQEVEVKRTRSADHPGVCGSFELEPGEWHFFACRSFR